MRAYFSGTLPIEIYAETHDSLSLSDVYKFDWDVAYVDRAYSDGTWIREKYGLEFDVKSIARMSKRRILFFWDEKLVKIVNYDIFLFGFPENIEKITPELRFKVDWVDRTLHLSAE